MKNILLLIVALFVVGDGFTQSKQPLFSSNSKLNFEEFLKGVKYAEIILNPTNQEQVDKQIEIAPLYYVAQKYLMQIGFEYVALTSADKLEMEVSVESYCQY